MVDIVGPLLAILAAGLILVIISLAAVYMWYRFFTQIHEKVIGTPLESQYWPFPPVMLTMVMAIVIFVFFFIIPVIGPILLLIIPIGMTIYLEQKIDKELKETGQSKTYVPVKFD